MSNRRGRPQRMQMSAFKMTRGGAGLHSPSGTTRSNRRGVRAALLSHSATEFTDLATDFKDRWRLEVTELSVQSLPCDHSVKAASNRKDERSQPFPVN